MPRRLRVPTIAFAIAFASTGSPVRAEVVRLDIASRETILDGRAFGPDGAIGPYDKLTGTVHFAFDPANPFNARIVDLALAPRNDASLVEATADFMILTPRDHTKARRLAYVEVSNRGGKATLSYFQRARGGGSNPTDAAHFGDGLLMDMGVTIIWIGWQWDVPQRPGLLRLDAPIATNPDGTPITGLVRADWVVDEPVNVLDVAHRNHIAYPVLDPRDRDNRLTVRDGRLEARTEIPRGRWRFAIPTDDGGTTPDPTHIMLEGGFEPGMIYELVYRAADPRIVGLGLAAIRDIASYARYDETCPFPADAAIAFGVSQTGRFLRHFIYQGFNTDERNRKVYDGLLIHTAGAGRGSFNHRFAQPSRDAHRYSAFFYPTDLFPFAGGPQRNPETGEIDGLLMHQHDPEHLPKIFYTNTGYEYWGRAAALIHIDLDGGDYEPAPIERIYHLASGQHFIVGFPPNDRSMLPPADDEPAADAWRGNPLDFLVTLRALLVRLIDWVERDAEPPISQYPRIADGTLVRLSEWRFPPIPGIQAPTVMQEAYHADYGPRWNEGIIDLEPPVLSDPFLHYVPGVDEFGNELAGVPTVEIMAPLATYAPWCLRLRAPANQHELDDFYGTFIPLPLHDRQKRELEDPRSSAVTRYHTRETYLLQAVRAADMLIDRGVLLPQDRERVLERAAAMWDWIFSREEGE